MEEASQQISHQFQEWLKAIDADLFHVEAEINIQQIVPLKIG